jgi:hypothetical protein
MQGNTGCLYPPSSDQSNCGKLLRCSTYTVKPAAHITPSQSGPMFHPGARSTLKTARIFTTAANKDASATYRPTLLKLKFTQDQLSVEFWVSYQTRLPNPKTKDMSSGPRAGDSSDVIFDMCRSGMNLVGSGYFSGLRAIDLS